MLYHLIHLKNDTLFSYSDSSFSSDISYSQLKSLSIQVLENEVLPTSILPELNNWLKEQHIARFGNTATSFKTAIEAESISFEYDRIRENYPGSRVLQQALVFNHEKPYF